MGCHGRVWNQLADPDEVDAATISSIGSYTAGVTLPSSVTDYADAVSAFDERHRRLFYETLAMNLTVSARAVWSDEALSDSEKVDQLKWLNEILHRVIGKLRTPRSWPDAEFFSGVLQARVNESPAIAGHVDWAVKQSFAFADVQPLV